MFGIAKAKDQAFLGAFIDHAAQSVEAAALLLEMLEHPERKDRIAVDITEKEATGDRLTHETVKTPSRNMDHALRSVRHS